MKMKIEVAQEGKDEREEKEKVYKEKGYIKSENKQTNKQRKKEKQEQTEV